MVMKAFLLGGLLIHVDSIEPVVDAIIAQYMPVEDIHRCIDCRFSTQLFVQCSHVVSPC